MLLLCVFQCHKPIRRKTWESSSSSHIRYQRTPTLTFEVWRPSSGVGVFHARGLWSYTSSLTPSTSKEKRENKRLSPRYPRHFDGLYPRPLGLFNKLRQTKDMPKSPPLKIQSPFASAMLYPQHSPIESPLLRCCMPFLPLLCRGPFPTPSLSLPCVPFLRNYS